MDLASGYWQVELEPQDREKTAFTTGHALYHFKVMPTGLTNAPPTFQRLMELVLRGLHWKECLIYLDDVLVFSWTFSQHLDSLDEVLGRFRSAGLKLKASKCSFAYSQVTFLGHVVSSQGLQPDAKNLDKVLNWPTPTTTTEVRAFVGLCSYYRRFIRNFSVIAAPLHALTQKGALFSWMPACEDAFQSLKHALTNPPIVAHPVFSQPFLLYTDASQDCIGSVLAQVQEQKERVISYASHTLTPSQRKWSTYDCELWAIVWSVRHFKHFLAGTTFTIVTDHKPLLSLQKAAVESDPTGRRGHWILELGVYDYTVIHKEGKKHANADAMSRRPCFRMETKAVQCVLTTPVAREMATSTGVKEDVKHIPDICPTLSIDPDDMRKHQEADDTLCTVRAWMEVGRHRSHLGSLKGRSPTVRKLWHEFPKLSLRNGILCRKFKCSPHTLPVYQVVLPDVLIPTALKALHGNEFSGHLGADRTLQRARRICYWPYMSRDIHKFCLPCQTRSSPTPHERAPLQSIHANRPFQSIAADITELPITSKGHRYVLVIMDYFTRYINLFPLKDQRAVTVAQCIFEEYIRHHAYANDLTARLSQALGAAAQNSAAAKQHQKRQYDKKAVFHPHKAGDLVWLDDPAQRQNKLAPRWKGPFVILKRMDRGGSLGVTYEITDSKDEHSRRWVVHHNRLKAYKGSLPQEPVHSQEPTVSADAGRQPGPCRSNLTALSGALPFCPPAPTYVPPRPSVHVHVGSLTLESPPTHVPQTDPQPSASLLPVPSSSPGSPVPTVRAPLSMTRSGRIVRPPAKFKNFVV
ncbi:hypothetical protein MHYP_G00203800 [Metynnis hypsauchen]